MTITLTNIVEKSSGVKPNSIDFKEAQNKQGVIDIIIKKFENHPSIIKIKESCTVTSEGFKFIEINEEDIENMFREININASLGEDKIPPKLAKLARKYLVKPLKEAINSSILHSVFPNNAKTCCCYTT